MQRQLGYKKANKMFLYFTIIFIFFQIIVGLYSVNNKNIYEDKLYVMLLISQYATIFLPVIFFVFVQKYSFRQVFRLNKISIKAIILIMVMSIPAYFSANTLNTIVMYFFQGIIQIPESPIPVPQNINEFFIQIFVICLTPAICEESLNRGILLKGYEEMGTMRAVVISGIMFGVFHFDILNLAGPTFLGILIGYYVIKTNSIFAGVTAHFMNNFIAIILQYTYTTQPIETNSIFISNEDLMGSILFGSIVLLILFLLLKLFKKVTKDKGLIQISSNNLRKDMALFIVHWPIIVIFVTYILLTWLFFLEQRIM